MILSCPFCETRYLVSAQSFAQGARRVRCARCLHSWQVDTPSHIDVVAVAAERPITTTAAGDNSLSQNIARDQAVQSSASSPVSFAQELANQNAGHAADENGGEHPAPVTGQLPVPYDAKTPSWVRWTFTGSLLALIFVTALWLVLARQNIVAQWPSLEKTYNALGLHIFHTGEGLDLNDVRYEIVYESGAMNLVITGVIINTSQHAQKLPNIKATALGVDGQPILSWQIDAARPVLEEGEKIALQSTIKAPKETVTNLKLEYIEPPHEP